MHINSDFSRRAAVHAARERWVPSPIPGVERKMLDRVGDEIARATSIVRYHPGSHFSPHVHHGGEEFLVLDGVFQDESGDFPVGSYVRNPPQSSHTPRSDNGCTIFVKLWQFRPTDRTSVKASAFDRQYKAIDNGSGIESFTLFEDAREVVRIERWPADHVTLRIPSGGIEVLCLEGSFIEGGDFFSAQSWLRLPPGQPLEANCGKDGCLLWIKEGHLRDVSIPAEIQR